MGTKKWICCLVSIMERNYTAYNCSAVGCRFLLFTVSKMVGDEESSKFWGNVQEKPIWRKKKILKVQFVL